MALTSKLTAIGDAIREKLGTTQTYTLEEMATAIRSIASTLDLDITNDAMAAYLASVESSYTDDNYSSVSVVGNFSSASENHDDPKGLEVAVTADGTITVTDETNNDYSYTDAVTKGTYTIYNLIPNHSYRYNITDSSGNSIGNGKISVTGKIRQIYYSADDNARDLGDGETIRYGILFRGAGVGETAYKDILVNQIKIQHEIDLQENADTPLYGVDYSRFGLFTPSSSYSELFTNTSYLDTFKACLVQIMTNAVNGKRTYIHCSRGIDRTGTICFYLQALCGLAPKELDIHYETTCMTGSLWSSSLQNIKRTFSPWVGLRNYFKNLWSDDLVTNCLYWAYTVGIDIDLINNYRKAMMVKTPKTLSYEEFETKYTNQIPISIETDGSVFGYKKDYRLDSSGNAVSSSGFYATGLIPVKAGDIVRLQGVQHRKGASTASNQRISVFTSAKAHIAQGNVNYPPSSYVTNCKYDSNNDLIQFTVAGSTVAYFRLSAQYIDNSSVITVNEEIS